MKSIAFVSVKKAFSVFLAFLLLFSACFVVAPVFSSAITAETSGFTATISASITSGGNYSSVSSSSVSVTSATATQIKLQWEVNVSTSNKDSSIWGGSNRSHTMAYTIKIGSVVVATGTKTGSQTMWSTGDKTKTTKHGETVTITRTLSGVKLSGSFCAELENQERFLYNFS